MVRAGGGGKLWWCKRLWSRIQKSVFLKFRRMQSYSYTFRLTQAVFFIISKYWIMRESAPSFTRPISVSNFLVEVIAGKISYFFDPLLKKIFPISNGNEESFNALFELFRMFLKPFCAFLNYWKIIGSKLARHFFFQQKQPKKLGSKIDKIQEENVWNVVFKFLTSPWHIRFKIPELKSRNMRLTLLSFSTLMFLLLLLLVITTWHFGCQFAYFVDKDRHPLYMRQMNIIFV